MHYRSGKQVKVGDLARTIANPEYAKVSPQIEIIGVVVAGTPSASSCNLQIATVAMRNISPIGNGPWIPTQAGGFAQCQNAGDTELILRADGSDGSEEIAIAAETPQDNPVATA